MNIVFSCMNFQLTSAKQTTLHKQGSTQTNTLLSMTVHIFLYSLINLV